MAGAVARAYRRTAHRSGRAAGSVEGRVKSDSCYLGCLAEVSAVDITGVLRRRGCREDAQGPGPHRRCCLCVPCGEERQEPQGSLC